MRHSAKHLKVQNRKPKYRAAVLGGLVLLMAVAVSVSVSFAKMQSAASGKSGGAQVAAFIADASGEENAQLQIDIPYDIFTQTYSLQVTNRNAGGKAAEVALSYDVVFTLPRALPDSLTFTLDGKTAVLSNNDTVVTFENAGTFSASTGATKNHILTITANADLIDQNYKLADIAVDVVAKQVD